MGEGFRAFFDRELVEQMDVLLWLELSKKTCHKRRMATTRVTEQYFKKHLWPRHLEYKEAAFARGGPMVTTTAAVLDGEKSPEAILEDVLGILHGSTSAPNKR